jgi:Tol biopolymer transport system component
MVRLLAVVAVAGCRLHFDALDDAGAAAGDGSDDGAMLGAWSTPMPVPEASDAGDDEEDASLSADGLTLYFTASGGGQRDLFTITRTTTASPWQPRVELPINDALNDYTARLAANELTLYFASQRAGGTSNDDLYTATRGDTSQPFTNVQLILELQTNSSEKWLSPCTGGIYVTVRDEQLFQGKLGVVAPTAISELNMSGYESAPYLLSDCLTLYFASDRAGSRDLYVTHRIAPNDAWDPPTPLTEFNTASGEEDPWISADGKTFIFTSDRMGTDNVFISTR